MRSKSWHLNFYSQVKNTAQELSFFDSIIWASISIPIILSSMGRNLHQPMQIGLHLQNKSALSTVTNDRTVFVHAQLRSSHPDLWQYLLSTLVNEKNKYTLKSRAPVQRDLEKGTVEFLKTEREGTSWVGHHALYVMHMRGWALWPLQWATVVTKGQCEVASV